MSEQHRHGTEVQLQSLLADLDKDYYGRLQALCEKAEMHIAELHGGDIYQTASLYTSLAKQLIGQVTNYISNRRVGFLLYLTDLLEKEDSGHDCRSCSSSCTVRHTAQIADISDTHGKMRETLHSLQSVRMPDDHDSPHAETFLALHKEILLVDSTLTRLFYLEESSLLPKVMEAQKAIHAHG